MLNKNFLLNGNKDEERAFIAGWRALAQVLAHCSVDDYSGLLSRNDKDWIIYLCQCESERERHERRLVAQSVVECCNIDKEEFRGMLLDCCRVNDLGIEVNKNGITMSEHDTYHNKYYEDEKGDQYTETAYRNASPEDRERLEEVSYINLTDKAGSTVRQVTMHNTPFMEALIDKIIPTEPEAVINLYYQALTSENKNPVLSMYGGSIAQIITARRGYEALCSAVADTGNISDDNNAETGADSNEPSEPLARPYESAE